MTFYLRTSDTNLTLAEVELYRKSDDENTDGYVELSSWVNITNYSFYLLEHMDDYDKIVYIFSRIDDLRGWLWEHYFMGRKNTIDEFDAVFTELRQMLRETAKVLGLVIVED